MNRADASLVESSVTLGLDDTRGNEDSYPMWSELESGRLIASSSGIRGSPAAVSELDVTLPVVLEEPLMASSPVKAKSVPVPASPAAVSDVLATHSSLEPVAPDGKLGHICTHEFLS